MSLQDTATEALVISIASKTTYTAGAASFMGWLASIDILSLVGAFVAVAGLVVNVYFLIRKDRRETIMHKQRVAELQQRMERNLNETDT